MKIVLVVVAALALAASAAAGLPRNHPVPSAATGAFATRAAAKAYLPTGMLAGFHYTGWSFHNGVLRVEFRNAAGWTVEWTVAETSGPCRTGMQKSYQLAGNKVYWASTPSLQFAWRCVTAANGRALRLRTSSPVPPTKLAAPGLGGVTASGKRV